MVAVGGTAVGVKVDVGSGVLVTTVGVAVGMAVVVAVAVDVAIGVSVGVLVRVAVGVGPGVGVFVIVGGAQLVGVGSSVVLDGKVAVAAPTVGVSVGVPTVAGARPLGARASAVTPMQ